ncbi:hypothetical protein [Terrihabitans sp. B22-R8]|uniref:hypothetical protein n=1 Tax=Terrihabitans sp. B22-R8 TaxID=3425128 RepID=UPI00403D0BAB
MIARSIFLASVLVACAAPAFAAELVQPSDLERTLFDSTPITSTDHRGRTSELMFAPGGKLTRKTAAGQASEGNWRLSETGFCMKLGDAKRESCYLVLRGGKGVMKAVKISAQPFTWTH